MFRHVEFATVPTPDPELPSFFPDGHFADYDSCDAAACAGKTSYRGEYPLARDRRYFVKVAANAGEERLTSGVWVIDDAKPLIPGNAPIGSGEVNRPVAGRPFEGLVLPTVVPTGSASVPRVPRTIRAVLVAGVRVRVTCSLPCGVEMALTLNGRRLARRDTGYALPGTRTLVFRPTGAGRALLRRRSRARLRVGGFVSLLDGSRKPFSKSFTVRR